MDSFIVCIFLLLLTYVIVILLKSSRSCRKLPPGPVPLPIIGNLLALGNKPHKSLAKLAKIYGPIMTLKLGQVTTVVISSESLAREVLKKHDLSFSSRSIPDCMRALNHHEVSVSWMPISTTWKNLRRICNTHLFSAQKLNSSQHLRHQKLQELISDVQESCRSGAAVDIGEAALKATLNLLSSSIFSVNLADQSSQFVREFKETGRSSLEEAARPNLSDYFPIVRKFDLQGIRSRMTGHIGKNVELFDSFVEQRLQLRYGSSCGDSNTNDMLDNLIDIMENGNEDIERKHVLHLLMDLFAAGTDTTSSTTEWAMAELMNNPKVLSKAKGELEQITGKGKLIEESDIAKLPFLQGIIKETLRLHPPAPFLLPRKSLEDVDISGFTIPKGAQVLVNAWAIGRDPDTWDNPDEFAPQRFLALENEVDFKGRDFKLIPFGAGRRICPGLPLADRLMHIIVGSLVNMFNWKLEDGILAGDLNMQDRFGLTLQMDKPLRVIPMSL